MEFDGAFSTKGHGCLASPSTGGEAVPSASPSIPRTHCANGHPYDEKNTIYRADGRRVCKKCKWAREKAQRSRSVHKPGYENRTFKIRICLTCRKPFKTESYFRCEPCRNEARSYAPMAEGFAL